jgi:thymidylate synthase
MASLLHTAEQPRCNRTGCPTYSLFGRQFRFALDNNKFPLMTTRKMFLRGIFEELMLYLRGQTDSKILEKKGIHVWRGNTTRQFLDKNGLTLPEGDMGHSYGFSFRHFGAEYKTCHDNYDGQGFDQLYYVINEINKNPTSRRLIISLWEPNHMHKAALPPCLYNYQFYVSNGQLSCMMTQRSSDFALAGGWNIATGALLTYFIAHYTNTKPFELIWNIGDLHIYHNNLSAVAQQITRNPNIYPKLYLTNMPEKIDNITYDNLQLINYCPQGHISMNMNV